MKGPEAFRTISEAADVLGVPQHVLRFWETKFSFIRPMKRAGGRRFYRPQDLDVLRGVRMLLHVEGYTIKGVQRLHKEEGVKRVLQAASAVPSPEAPVKPSPVKPSPAPAPLAADDAWPVDLFGEGHGLDLSPDERARLSTALNGLLTAKARLERLIEGR